MSRTVSVKPTATLSEQCSQCALFFQWLHASADGRFLCAVYVRLEGENRATPLHLVTGRGAFRG
jgi:hypothetical protein